MQIMSEILSEKCSVLFEKLCLNLTLSLLDRIVLECVVYFRSFHVDGYDVVISLCVFFVFVWLQPLSLFLFSKVNKSCMTYDFPITSSLY